MRRDHAAGKVAPRDRGVLHERERRDSNPRDPESRFVRLSLMYRFGFPEVDPNRESLLTIFASVLSQYGQRRTRLAKQP
jgi:hypothetical protein